MGGPKFLRFQNPKRLSSGLRRDIQRGKRPPGTKGIQGAGHRRQVFLHDMGVDLGGFHIRMAHLFLHDSDIHAIFEQVGGVAVAKGVPGDPLWSVRCGARQLAGLLQPGGKHMVAVLTTAARIDAAFLGQRDTQKIFHVSPLLGILKIHEARREKPA